MSKKSFKQISIVSLFIFFISFLIYIWPPVSIVRIKNVKFSTSFDSNALFCFPAAYTNPDGSIQGEYKIDGITYGTPSRKEKISIHPTKGLIISGQWQSDNGFQQTVLVKNNKVRTFNDKRKRIRRALCTEGENSKSFLLIQSTYPMTLTEFAKEIRKYSYNAVNLDTGTFGYGWNGKAKYHLWTIFNKNKQTNWITC